MADPNPKETKEVFDAYDETYDNAVNRAVSFTRMDVDLFTRIKAEYIREICEAHFGDCKQLSVLDIGCGIGNIHKILGHTFGTLHGVDVSSACISKAASRFSHLSYCVYDGIRLPFEDNSFDMAYTVCVMHHVPPVQWPHFARSMLRVVRPGGVALVFEHNPRNPLTMRAVNSCPFDKDAVLLQSSQVEKLLLETGFQDSATRFIIAVPAVSALLRKIDRVFSRLPLGAQYYVSAVKP